MIIMMNKEFVPYEESLSLKELGFDVHCFRGYYNKQEVFASTSKTVDFNYKSSEGEMISTPLWQQAFRWFRIHKKLEYHIKSDMMGYYTYIVDRNTHKTVSMKPINMFKTYEEAELACLKELINIVKNNNH